MIYFIITTSIFDDSHLRKQKYIDCIPQLQKCININNITDYKIIIVENNGKRQTYLDTLGYDVFYTENNFINTNNKGIKELKDIIQCIDNYKINDNDFIVKLTGRYFLEETSEFMQTLKNVEKYDCIIKYGSYLKPVNYKLEDCITGCIGLRCNYVKKIEMPNEEECVEWKWAKMSMILDDKKIHMLDKIGLHICPGADEYYIYV